MSEMYQSVVIAFSNGITATFVGRPVVVHADEIENLRVTCIGLTEPKPLPDDCSFSLIDTEDGPSGG